MSRSRSSQPPTQDPLSQSHGLQRKRQQLSRVAASLHESLRELSQSQSQPHPRSTSTSEQESKYHPHTIHHDPLSSSTSSSHLQSSQSQHQLQQPLQSHSHNYFTHHHRQTQTKRPSTASTSTSTSTSTSHIHPSHDDIPMAGTMRLEHLQSSRSTDSFHSSRQQQISQQPRVDRHSASAALRSTLQQLHEYVQQHGPQQHQRQEMQRKRTTDDKDVLSSMSLSSPLARTLIARASRSTPQRHGYHSPIQRLSLTVPSSSSTSQPSTHTEYDELSHAITSLEPKHPLSQQKHIYDTIENMHDPTKPILKEWIRDGSSSRPLLSSTSLLRAHRSTRARHKNSIDRAVMDINSDSDSDVEREQEKENVGYLRSAPHRRTRTSNESTHDIQHVHLRKRNSWMNERISISSSDDEDEETKKLTSKLTASKLMSHPHAHAHMDDIKYETKRRGIRGPNQMKSSTAATSASAVAAGTGTGRGTVSFSSKNKDPSIRKKANALFSSDEDSDTNTRDRTDAKRVPKHDQHMSLRQLQNNTTNNNTIPTRVRTNPFMVRTRNIKRDVDESMPQREPESHVMRTNNPFRKHAHPIQSHQSQPIAIPTSIPSSPHRHMSIQEDSPIHRPLSVDVGSEISISDQQNLVSPTFRPPSRSGSRLSIRSGSSLGSRRDFNVSAEFRERVLAVHRNTSPIPHTHSHITSPNATKS